MLRLALCVCVFRGELVQVLKVGVGVGSLVGSIYSEEDDKVLLHTPRKMLFCFV